MNIVIECSDDVESYFCDVVLCYQTLNLTPLLAFIQEGSDTTVRIINKTLEVLLLPDETQVLGQWANQYHSNYFKFTVGVLRAFIAANPHRITNAKLLPVGYVRPVVW